MNHFFFFSCRKPRLTSVVPFYRRSIWGSELLIDFSQIHTADKWSHLALKHVLLYALQHSYLCILRKKWKYLLQGSIDFHFSNVFIILCIQNWNYVMHNSSLLFDRLYQKAVTVPINVDKKWGGGNSEIFVPSEQLSGPWWAGLQWLSDCIITTSHPKIGNFRNNCRNKKGGGGNQLLLILNCGIVLNNRILFGIFL